MSAVIPLTRIVSAVGAVRVIIIAAAVLVHQAVPRTITIHGVCHRLICGEFFTASLASVQSVTSLALIRLFLSRIFPIDQVRLHLGGENRSMFGTLDVVNTFVFPLVSQM